MKRNDYILLLRLMLISIFVVSFTTSCNDKDDESLGQLYGYAYAEHAVAQKVNMQIREGTVLEKKINFVLRRKAVEDVEISYQYDASLVEAINAKYKKSYKVYPKDLLLFLEKQ